VFAGAIGSNDDHVINMTYTCHRDTERYGNPLDYAAAAGFVPIGKST
jgi:hypothetical protein